MLVVMARHSATRAANRARNDSRCETRHAVPSPDRLDSDRGPDQPDRRGSRSASWSSTSRKAARASTSARSSRRSGRAEPDIVALEEAVTQHRPDRRRRSAGPSPRHRTQVISRYPIVEPADAVGVYVLVEVRPGRVVAVASVHPPAEPYGPELARRWRDRGRGDRASSDASGCRSWTRILAVLPGLAAAGIPVFLLGDFNAPSHLDWTAEAVGSAAGTCAGRSTGR